MSKGSVYLAGWVMAVCSGFSTAPLADKEARVYTGTLGGMPIVLELDSSSGEGRYFYRKYRKDLMLSGKKQGQTLVLDEGQRRHDSDAPGPQLHLVTTADGLDGEWRSGKGKVLKIELEPARLADVPGGTLPYIARLHDSAPYEYLRLQGMTLKPGKTGTFNGYSLQWWIEPQTKLTLFEVVSGYSVEERQRINQQLLGRLWQEVVGYYGCLAGGEASSYDQTIKPLLMTPSVISVNIGTAYSCGGPYPDHNNVALNLDAKTGRPLVLEDVLWVGEGKPLHYDELDSQSDASADGFAAFSAYRSNEFAPWLVAQFLKLYPNPMSSDEECAYSEEDPWRFPSWYFTDKGLMIEPSFPHVAAACGGVEWSVLPYSLVSKHPGAVALKLP
ncbi:hypothetical protein SAMN03159507_04427 [Pseudomonas sp. NFACC32-1]|uniref:hypothetical protein n=1 Tax=unclassified Pseudomonas TaxID=196821 RepID=UPI0008765489|nr:hypothetical protein [Pseudomonas sp. NFACC32-1]SCX70657.1 hypothetical protein SAMN03159507_04427 [Pseudomonas sp. NFACC32-1]